jgi:hypothetical protein
MAAMKRLPLCASLFALACGCGFLAAAEKPDLGPNVFLFNPTIPAAQMQADLNKVYVEQQFAEFGSSRYAFLFAPGSYQLDVPIGFYTQVLGLGATPDAVTITGNVHSDASRPRNNATCTFWKGVEGFTVRPTGGSMQWAVSQAVPFRRMHIEGNLVLHQQHGWASGGWMADSSIDQNVDSGTQQQWISRNSRWGSWTGANWNMVFVGIPNPPAGEWPNPPFTQVAAAPVVREKPFLYVDAKGNYLVRVPAVRTNSSSITWANGETPGRSIPLSRFYIAKPGDSAANLNAQLAQGKNLLLTPGNYELEAALKVEKAETIVLGLGFATLKPVKGTAAIETADADGIIVAGLLIDAGETLSPILLQVGPRTSHRSHVKDPITLADIFFRVGGAGVGKAGINLEVNANDTLIDHTWIWRADHGQGVGWTQNLSANGLVVNGDRVIAYGLFVEHHQQFQVLWNGNAGRTYFYQSEIPYDPPSQASYTSAPGTNGWASYKVADTVTTHEAWGLGIYSVFRHPEVVLTRAIETPERPAVRFHHMITVALDNLGEISNVINNTGGPTSTKPRVTPKLEEFPRK